MGVFVCGTSWSIAARGAIQGIFVRPDPEWTGAPGHYVSSEGSFSTIGVDDYGPDHRLAFGRWLEAIGAEASFFGGTVAVSEEPTNHKAVLVAVTPADLVFFDEGGAEDGAMPELGRFPRSAVTKVDVVDEHGVHVPEPTGNLIDEPSSIAVVVVDWQAVDAETDRDEFAFLAASLAWDTAHRFRRFALPPLLA